MHELSVATELLGMCERNLAPGEKIAQVRIAVGELASIEPELLQFAFAAVVAGTVHAGARLEIEWHPAQQSCSACGDLAERQPGTWLRLCPHCQLPLQIRGGDQLDLLELLADQIVDTPPEVPS